MSEILYNMEGSKLVASWSQLGIKKLKVKS